VAGTRGKTGRAAWEDPAVWEFVLFFGGIVVQLGGVVLTIKGARQVWKDVRSPDDRFLA